VILEKSRSVKTLWCRKPALKLPPKPEQPELQKSSGVENPHYSCRPNQKTRTFIKNRKIFKVLILRKSLTFGVPKTFWGHLFGRCNAGFVQKGAKIFQTRTFWSFGCSGLDGSFEAHFPHQNFLEFWLFWCTHLFWDFFTSAVNMALSQN